MTSFKSSASTRWIIVILAGTVIIGTGLAIGLSIGLRSRDNSDVTIGQETTGPLVTYKSGHGRYRFASVVADATICSQIGTEVLARQGGHVVDATVATVICDGVVNAHSSGIGGGDFIIYYDRRSRKATAVNARETAPAAATEDMFVGNASLSVIGGKSIAVPGQLKGLWELHRKYGRIEWAKLIQPTIRLCKEGTPLTEAMSEAIKLSKSGIFGKAMFSSLFDSKGETKPAGSVIYRPELAATLEKIATEGADAFYNGSLTDGIVADIRDAGGIITRADLENYQVDETDTVSFNLTRDGLVVYSMPPPGSGVVLEYLLNILSGYNFSPESIKDGNDVLTYHRIIEAMKFAFARRTELGDARFLNLTDLLTNMTSPEVGEQIRKLIDDTRTHNATYYGPTFYDVVKPGTAHFSLMDGAGNVVSMTSTINTRFGSAVIGSRTGIVFNSEMDDFSTPNTTNYYGVPASPANFIRPGKRPLSSMNPTVVVDADGDVKLVVGAAGGTMITTSTALVTMNTLWFNMTVTAAVDAPRLHHQLLPADVKFESSFPQKIIDGLKAKGHIFGLMGKTVVTAIHRTTDNMLEAVSDYRKWGNPDGF